MSTMNILTAKLENGMVPASPLAAPSDSTPGIRQYLRIAQRWRWVIVGAIAACVFLGLVITLLMTPQYTGTSTIEISRESAKLTQFEGVEGDTSVADQEFYQTQYGLLRARSLAERVASELQLVDDRVFFEMFGVSADDGPFNLASGRYPASGREERQRVAGEILLANLSIDPVRLSRLVDIRFTSPSADFSARVANSWAENYIETNLERKVQATFYGREQLERQLADYKQRLGDSQRQLVTYASAQGIINLPIQDSGDGSTQERSIVADNLAALNSSLNSATADRIEAQARYQQSGRAGASVEALGNAAISNLRARRADLAAEYERLLVRFEPGYPEAQALNSQIQELDQAIRREEGRVTNSLEASYRAAAERERDLQQRVAALKSDYLDLRRRSIQYDIFQQEVDTNQSLYDGLLQRYKEVGVAGGVGVNNIAIVDLADVPKVPTSPSLLLNLLISIIAGTMLGAALALGLEQMDEAISDPTELERRLGLPLLGSVPKVDDDRPLEALLDRKSELFDAYLAVQTNLSFTTEHGLPRTFAVTSTRPAEGKSTTALALATTMARSNRKVILVDGDMRSPSVHHLGGTGHERGLSNFLAGDDNIADLTFEMEKFGLTAMSAGPIPPNAAELLTGNRLSVLLARLLDTYDHVVVDAPPVMGLADAPLIGSRVEGVIYVVESHGIRSTQVKTALSRLATTQVRVIGSVMTKFEASKSHYGYEYGYDYGRGDEVAKPA
jgi:capsular exopolysaccharide synthesis family protein